MNNLKINTSHRLFRYSLILLSLAAIAFLYLYRLGSLTKGVSLSEVQASHMAVGFHGVYHSPFYTPLKLVRSIDFFLFKTHGQTLTRLPNVLFGLLSIACLTYLVKMWHGKRNALLIGVMFTISAWTLHVSRLASFDVMYLFAACSLTLAHGLLRQKNPGIRSWYFNALIWGILITIPGCIWLVILDLFLQRELILKTFRTTTDTISHKLIAAILFIIWLPLTLVNLSRAGQIKLWLGLPTHFVGIIRLLKNFVGVIIHLFIRGPQYPQIWLGKAPVLDAFTLAMALIGMYFYFMHYDSPRAKSLASMFLVSWILIALAGPVSFSLIVPFAYIFAAMGVSYLLHLWTKRFPNNPLAKNFGIALVVVVILASCVYNFRSYFVAWPNNTVTLQTFSFRLKSVV
jgi:hypothetical protein